MTTRHGRSLSGWRSGWASGSATRRAAVLVGALLLCTSAAVAARAGDPGSSGGTPVLTEAGAAPASEIRAVDPTQGVLFASAVACADAGDRRPGCAPSVVPLSAAGLLVLVFGLVATALVAIRPFEPHRG